ncbi:MAG: VapC toxin family PIN domain ribonuclease [Acidimicrobiales bacterium]
MTAGPHLASTTSERSRRQARLQQVETKFDRLGFDATAAHSHGQGVAGAAETGGSDLCRIADLLITAIAHADGLVPYTRARNDFSGLDDPARVIGV